MNWLLNKTKGDFVIWMVIFLLAIISLLAVYSSTGTLAYQHQGGNTEYYFFKHLFLLLFGLLMIYLCHLIDFRYYSRIAQILLILSVPLLLLTYFLGLDIHNAKRWLMVPGINVSIQTSDIAKVALIMYTARMLSKKQEVIKDFRKAFLPIMTAIVLVCGLIAPADLSTAVILFACCFILLFIGRVKLKFLALLVAICFSGAALFTGVLYFADDGGRIATWEQRIESFANEENVSYQNKQAKIAIATGGLFGKGPGNSTQRNFLPNPYSDFIYAIIIEEWGLLGGIFVMLLYLILLYRCILIVIKSPFAFGALLALGLSLILVLQGFVNMGVAVHLLPVTGLTLPMVSMGGTSLLFTSVSLGIILSVSRYIEEEEAEEESNTTQEAPVQNSAIPA